MEKLTSQLPYGKPFPVGDRVLWDDCMKRCMRAPRGISMDVMEMYANARGITRQAAKHETFIIRYGGNV